MTDNSRFQSILIGNNKPSLVYRLKDRVRKLSHRASIARTAYVAVSAVRTLIDRRLSDTEFARRKYLENTGDLLDLNTPEGLNEKLWWLKLNNRDPLLKVCTDKVAVRDYVKQAGFEGILNEVYSVWDSPKNIPWEDLPSRAFLKLSTGSGFNALFDRNRPFDKRKVVHRFSKAMKRDYYWQSREWNYKGIQPQILIERVLPDENLIDFRILCFSGIARLVFVDIETMAPDGTHAPYARRNVYDRDFRILPAKVRRQTFPAELVERPNEWYEMVAVAEKLAAPFPFCRVDLYNVEGRIVFGELTFYPGGCTQTATPRHFEEEWGKWVDLEDKAIIRSAEDRLHSHPPAGGSK